MNENNNRIPIDLLLNVIKVPNYEIFHFSTLEFVHKWHTYKQFQKALDQLNKLMNGEKGFFSYKVQKYYELNKKAIELLNQDHAISDFLFYQYYNTYYLENGYFDAISYFSAYLKIHQTELEQIKKAVEKLKTLGITFICLDTYRDLTKETFSWDLKEEKPCFYVYQPVVVPTAKTDEIIFQSKETPYCIKRIPTKDSKNPYLYEILVNTLLFDTKKLPESLDSENLLTSLMKQKLEQRKLVSMIQKSVEMTILLEEIQKELKKLEKQIEFFDYRHQEMKKSFKIMQEQLLQIAIKSIEYDRTILDNYPSYTWQNLEEEVIEQKKDIANRKLIRNKSIDKN